jgi:hypothetical protein
VVWPTFVFSFRKCSILPRFSRPSPPTTSLNSSIYSASVMAQGISLSRLRYCTTRSCSSSRYLIMRSTSEECGGWSQWQQPCDLRRRMAAILGCSKLFFSDMLRIIIDLNTHQAHSSSSKSSILRSNSYCRFLASPIVNRASSFAINYFFCDGND